MKTKFEEVQIEYEIATDSKGFCVNACIGDDDFDSSTVSAYLILIAKNLCRETGKDFAKLLRSALVISEKADRAQA